MCSWKQYQDIISIRFFSSTINLLINLLFLLYVENYQTLNLENLII